MAFKNKGKKPKPGIDCKDFKPMFWDRNHCKLSDKCDFGDQYYIAEGRFGCGGYCTGIKWDVTLLDNNNPPQGGSGVPNKQIFLKVR